MTNKTSHQTKEALQQEEKEQRKESKETQGESIGFIEKLVRSDSSQVKKDKTRKQTGQERAEPRTMKQINSTTNKNNKQES